jgi:hypothetical protein
MKLFFKIKMLYILQKRVKGKCMQIIELAAGWSTGQGFALAKYKEDEVKQGKNYYQASLCQAFEICNLSNVVSQLVNSLPNPYVKTSLKIGSTATSILGFVLCPTFAAVKQGHYEDGVKALNAVTRNSLPRLADRLPEKLSERTTALFGYLAEHSGDIATSAMILGTAALPILGNVYFAGAMLTPITYQAIDSRHWVPRRISLFMENYMPTVASAATLVGGGPIMQVISALHLSSFSPTFNKFLHSKLDTLAKNVFHLTGPSLQEIDAPLVVNKELSFDIINNILNCDDSSPFTINPAHCSKWACDLKKLATNNEFSKYLELFEKIDWSSKYSSLKTAFRDDDRFLDFLEITFPGKTDFYENFDSYVTELAINSSLNTKEVYLANQLKNQMIQLIKVLKGESRATGSQRDTEEAIENCSQILAHLLQKNWDVPIEKIELEDTILKLAVEGGEYCARGVKRTSREIVNGILYGPQGQDPVESYEIQLRQSLEMGRMKIMTCLYQDFIGVVVKGIKYGAGSGRQIGQVTDPHAVATAQDVHTFDFYRLAFALGFVPLTEYERSSIGINDLNLWGNPMYGFREFRLQMYHTYQRRLHDLINELGGINFFNYIHSVIKTNLKLSEEQKTDLIEKLTERNSDAWTVEETENRFHRLALVMLGVLHYNPIEDDWIEILPNSGPPIEQEEDFSDWTSIEKE